MGLGWVDVISNGLVGVLEVVDSTRMDVGDHLGLGFSERLSRKFSGRTGSLAMV